MQDVIMPYFINSAEVQWPNTGLYVNIMVYTCPINRNSQCSYGIIDISKYQAHLSQENIEFNCLLRIMK